MYEEIESAGLLGSRASLVVLKKSPLPGMTDPYGVNRKRKMKSDIQKFSEPCSVPQGQDLFVNDPIPTQQFDPFYSIPECSIPNGPMAIPAQDGAVHLPLQSMEEIQYEEFKHEDTCVSLDPDTLETIYNNISQCLGFSFIDNMDTKSKLEVNQPLMNMSTINDAHFSQMVSESQPYLQDLENVEDILFPVKSEDVPDI